MITGRRQPMARSLCRRGATTTTMTTMTLRCFVVVVVALAALMHTANARPQTLKTPQYGWLAGAPLARAAAAHTLTDTRARTHTAVPHTLGLAARTRRYIRLEIDCQPKCADGNFRNEQLAGVNRRGISPRVLDNWNIETCVRYCASTARWGLATCVQQSCSLADQLIIVGSWSFFRALVFRQASTRPALRRCTARCRCTTTPYACALAHCVALRCTALRLRRARL